MDMKQFRATNNGQYNGRRKRGSIIMEQYISMIIIFCMKINDKDSEQSYVYVSHISIYLSNIHYTNRSILKIQNIFSSIRYREVYNFGNSCIKLINFDNVGYYS